MKPEFNIIDPDELNAANCRACPRNLAFNVAHGVSFDCDEQIGFDPATRMAVKADAPNAVPLGVVQHFVPQPSAAFDVVFVFTFESFYRDFDHRGERRSK
jgi:hypothetical protein